MVASSFTVTVREDGTVRLPADAARPGETITVRITRPERPAPDDESVPEAPSADEPDRLTRLTAKTPEQKAELRRQIDELIDRIAPMLKDVPNNTDWLYDENGLPK